MEFMSHADSARFRESLTCGRPFQAGSSQSRFARQKIQTLQVYNTKAGVAVDIVVDSWAIASAADPTGSPRIDA